MTTTVMIAEVFWKKNSVEKKKDILSTAEVTEREWMDFWKILLSFIYQARIRTSESKETILSLT